MFLISNRDDFGQIFTRYQAIYGMYQTIPVEEIERSSRGVPSKGDLFIFPIIDWHYRKQRPQHLTQNLSKLGYRIFYFSTSPLMDMEGAPYRIVEQPSQNLYICRIREGAIRVDDLNRKTMSAKTSDGYAASLHRLMSDLDIHAPIVILHHPYWTPLAQRISGARIGYDCMDLHRGFVSEPEMDKSELMLIEAADFIVVTSMYLKRKIANVRNAEFIPNGCDFKLFASLGPPPRGARPVAGYIGAIADWFDMELLVSVAEQLPDWRFILVGSAAGSNTSITQGVSNIEFIGEVPYENIPAHLACFDVCMIPFKITELTKATNPVKVYEYLAAGRPVVSTPLPEVETLADKVKIAKTPREFVSKLKESLCVDHSQLRKWRHWAGEQDWSQRALAFERVMTNQISRVIM